VSIRRSAARLIPLLAAVLLACGTPSGPPTLAAGAQARTTTFPAGARFDYQIGGAYRPPSGVVIVDRDRHARPVTGHYNICYLNAFQAQPSEIGWWRRHHRNLLLHDASGREVVDRGWNEVLLDVGTAGKRRALARIEGGWIDRCARRGFQAIEPDNLDSWGRSRRLLTADDAVAFATLLSRRAHHDSLLIAQKNAVQLSGRRSTTGFDFAIAEECQVYRECGGYTRVYARRVIEIEYTDNGRRAFAESCALRGSRISIELADRDVLPAGSAGHVRRFCRS
jgi:hypothetical protein